MKSKLKSNYASLEYLFAHRIKFLCSVSDDYEVICPAPVIYYDPVTYLPSLVIDGLHLEYRADFLIRHRINGNAFLVDLQPASMAHDARLWLRRRIAQSYIALKEYDWEYQCLFPEEIELNHVQSARFESYSKLETARERLGWLVDFLMLSYRAKPKLLRSRRYSFLDFLIHGILPEKI